MIKTIEGLLKKICDQYQGPWVNWISAACYIVRTNVYLGHGFTPFFLIHGRQPRGAVNHLDYDLQDLPFIETSSYKNTINDTDSNIVEMEQETDNPTTEEIELLANRLQQIISLNEDIIPQAIQRQNLIKQNQAAQFDIQHKAKIRKYRIGDSIMMKNNSLGELSINNLGTTWVGPFKIESILPRDVYIVADEN